MYNQNIFILLDISYDMGQFWKRCAYFVWVTQGGGGGEEDGEEEGEEEEEKEEKEE